MPNLIIKCFNGNPTEFQSFFDSIRAAIPENGSLKSIAKFNYLRTFLRGPALALISGLPLTAENCNQAIKILEKRYGNEQLLITLHTDELLSVSSILQTILRKLERPVTNWNKRAKPSFFRYGHFSIRSSSYFYRNVKTSWRYKITNFTVNVYQSRMVRWWSFSSFTKGNQI